MKVLNDLNFTTETANGNVVVDFYADWCGPCHMLSPILEQIDSERENVTIVKVDVDTSPVTASKFGIRSIPTMVFLKNGIEVDRVSGALPKAVMVQHLNNIFG